MKYQAAIFLGDTFVKTSGDTPEDALQVIQDRIQQPITYRPADGMVYLRGSHVPCGIIFRQGI